MAFFVLFLQFMTKTLDAEMKFYTAAANIAEEVLAGIRTVLAFNAQPFEVKRYEKQLNEGRRCGIRKAKWVAGFSGLFNATQFISLAVAVFFGIKVSSFLCS